MTDARTDFYVYVLFRETGEPFYVGKGRARRINFHEWSAMNGDSHRDRVVRKVLLLRGDLPKVKVREGLTDDEAKSTEIALIAAIGRFPKGPLINQTDGGEGASALPPETKARIAAVHIGRKRSAETCRKLSEWQIGRTLPAETRAKMSHARRNPTPEARANMSAAQKGRKHSPATLEKMREAWRRRRERKELGNAL